MSELEKRTDNEQNFKECTNKNFVKLQKLNYNNNIFRNSVNFSMKPDVSQYYRHYNNVYQPNKCFYRKI